MNKTSVAVMIALLTLLTLFSGLTLNEVYAATQTVFTVNLLDGSNYTPMSGVKVMLNGPRNLSRISGSDGAAAFLNIPNGRYIVSFSSLEYPMLSPQVVQVKGNMSITLLYGHARSYFTYKPHQPLVNDTIAFDGSMSSSTGIITGYTWNFGDGSSVSDTAANTTHVFRSPGEYRVALTVISNVGSATYTQSVRVTTEKPQDNTIYLLGLPLLLPLLLAFFLLRRRHYYVVIQARIPPNRRHPHCPGNGDCDNCKLTPC